MSSARAEWEASKAELGRLHRAPLGPIEPENSGCEDEGNTIPAQKYEYSDNLGSYAIRLLQLQPGKRGDPLVVHISPTQRLDTCARQYYALSYVWGTSDKTKRVQVNEGYMNLRDNLCCALTHLREHVGVKQLWVDAICINQSSTEERNAQVPLMCEIFSQAAKTICFLGPERNTTRELYFMLSELAKEAQSVPGNDDTYAGVESFNVPVQGSPLSPLQNKLHDKYVGDASILALAACRWWHRAWTAQELLLSSNAILMIGPHRMEWTDVCAACDQGLAIGIWTPRHFGFMIDRAIVPYLSMRAMMRTINLKPLQESEPERMRTGSPASELLNLLTLCRYRESEDPRDKVYSVLGLLRQTYPDAMTPGHPGALDIKPDYNRPVGYVYRRVAHTIISHMDNVDILGTCTTSTRPSLPSWVTDWSATNHSILPLTRDAFDRDRTTHATARTKAAAEFRNDNLTLSLTGYELTSVTAVTAPLLDWDWSNLEVRAYVNNLKWFNTIKHFKAIAQYEHELFALLMSVYRVLFDWARFSTEEPATNTSENSTSIFWQTLCAGTYSDGSLQKTEDKFKSWFDSLQPLRIFMEKHPDIHEQLPEIAFIKMQIASWESYGEFWPYMACARHRRLGRSASSWLCLLPEKAEKGDTIALVQGGRVPLVIRLQDDGYYKYIGEAYIHGKMDGEAFDSSKCGEIQIC